jgi:TRAP-type C4-dicarboxylate transport system permease small subunit
MPDPDSHAGDAAALARMAPPRRAPFEEWVAVACMAALVAITLLNVVTRYLTDQSFAWTEEISIVLMVVMTLAGASAAVARDAHIRIEAFYDSGNARRQRALRLLSTGATALVFFVLTLLFVRTVADEIRWSETSMGLGVPRWWFTAAAPLLTAAITLRAVVLGWRVWLRDTPQD